MEGIQMEVRDRNVIYGPVVLPEMSRGLVPVNLTGVTWKERLHKVLSRMEKEGLDALAVYADREHGGNFAYLTGFEPRFEEAVLVLGRDGRASLMLGNENMKMCSYSMLKAEAVHVPYFSLPNQPMEHEKDMAGLFRKAGIRPGMTVGVAGWKMFTSRLDDNSQLFDVPCFIMEGIRRAAGDGDQGEDCNLTNAAHLLIHPGHGARTRVNANEIAHYEFGAALASDCVYEAMNHIAPGMTEMEVAGRMCNYGQPVSVTTICASGQRFDGAVVFPRNKKIQTGDKFSLTMGLRGGLSSRAAYVAAGAQDLEANVRDYVEVLAKPYYRAAVSWYEQVGIGVSGGELYRLIETVLPKQRFSWTLNPGHLTSDEEWMSSPIYPGSEIRLESGMMLQMDIIPGIPGYGGAGAEDGIVIADGDLREEIRRAYPDTWNRFERRRTYMETELGIRLKPEILPMSDLTGYMRPYLLNRTCAFKIVNTERIADET